VLFICILGSQQDCKWEGWCMTLLCFLSLSSNRGSMGAAWRHPMTPYLGKQGQVSNETEVRNHGPGFEVAMDTEYTNIQGKKKTSICLGQHPCLFGKLS
jgi:hypothetical protein